MKKIKEIIEKYNSSYFSKMYVFTGDKYLIDLYVRHIKKMCTGSQDDVMDTLIYKGKFDIKEVIQQSQTIPFMASKRIILIKNSGILTASQKDMGNYIKKNIDSIPESSIVIFIEDEIDKRNAFYKHMKNEDVFCEFAPSEGQLLEWIQGQAKEQKGKISASTALFFLRFVRGDMTHLNNEMAKVFNFSCEITEETIRSICQESIEVIIFDLMEEIAFKKGQAALKTYRRLLDTKEAPYKIYSLIERQIRFLLITKQALSKSMDNIEIAAILGVREFVVKDLRNQQTYFTLNELLNLYFKCENLERGVKIGQMDIELALELFIAELA
jgi:DNA polymerase-3 subunit delta